MRKAQLKNWWYYYKWYVLCGILLLLSLAQILGNALGWHRKKPDLQIAYVGEASLPEDTVSALEGIFSSLAEDYNHDGEILVQINQYASGSLADTSAQAMEYRQAVELRLIGDIHDGESYFFLLEHPEEFQRQYQALAMPDGSCPDSLDFSSEGKVISWKDSEALSEADAGEYTTLLLGQEITGSSQDLLSPLYLGRRCFYDTCKTENVEECAALWSRLKGDPQ